MLGHTDLEQVLCGVFAIRVHRYLYRFILAVVYILGLLLVHKRGPVIMQGSTEIGSEASLGNLPIESIPIVYYGVFSIIFLT